MRVLACFIAINICAAFLHAQDKPCSDLQVRVTKQPTYPPIAAAAHLSAKIELDLQVSAEAKFLRIENVSGPTLLQGAARDYVASWDLSWQNEGKHHPCVEKVIVDFKLLAPTKTVSSHSYEIVTEDGVSTTTILFRPAYYKPTVLY